MTRTLAIIGVPSALGAPNHGVAEGPHALRSAGLMTRLLAADADIDARDLGDVPTPAPDASIAPEFRGADSLALLVRARVASAIREGMVPVVLGGDHTVALGAIAASAAAHPDLGILWIDAHPDFNTPETSVSHHPHGMVLALAAGLGPQPALARLGRIPLVPAQRIFVLGARVVDAGERALLEKDRVRSTTSHDVIQFGADASVAEAVRYFAAHGAASVHVSIDLDVLDPRGFPGVSTPVPGGLNLDDLLATVESACSQMNVVSLDVVELDPTRDQDERTTQAGVAVIEAAASSLASARPVTP